MNQTIQELVDEFAANLLERESSDESDVANELNSGAYQALKDQATLLL